MILSVDARIYSIASILSENASVLSEQSDTIFDPMNYVRPMLSISVNYRFNIFFALWYEKLNIVNVS